MDQSLVLTRPNLQKIGKSRYDKIKDFARANGRDTTFAFRLYAFEGLISRLQMSEWKDCWYLKGGILIVSIGDGIVRMTDDLDFTSTGDITLESVMSMFKVVFDSAPPEEDGLSFEIVKHKCHTMRETASNPTVRMSVIACLHNFDGGLDIPFKVDVSSADHVIEPSHVRLPSLFKAHVAPTIPCYPWEIVVAEKLNAIATHGLAGTRLRDYWDLCALSRRFVLDTEKVAKAISATWHARGGTLTDDLPGLSSDFCELPDRLKGWSDLMSRTGMSKDAPKSFSDAISEIRDFVLPPLNRAIQLSQPAHEMSTR